MFSECIHELHLIRFLNYKSYTSQRQLEYRMMIASPKDEPPPNGYAVIYALDGDALFQTLAETVKLQTRKPKGFDPILVIGIGYHHSIWNGVAVILQCRLMNLLSHLDLMGVHSLLVARRMIS